MIPPVPPSDLIASLPTLATNAGVFFGLIAAAVLGYRSINKPKLADPVPSVAYAPSPGAILGASLQDNMSMMMLTEALRANTECNGRVLEASRGNTETMRTNYDMLRNLRDSVDRLEHSLRDNTSQLTRQSDRRDRQDS